MAKQNIKIGFPVTVQDFEDLVPLISENLAFDKNLTVSYYQNLSTGEIILAKEKNELVGILVHRRPGRIFLELADDHFDLENIKYGKADLGYVAIVVTDKGHQGKGIGKLLLKEALKYQKDFGSKGVIVHCWQSSPGKASEKLFGSFGFQPLKVHKQPWYEHSKKRGAKGYSCVVCGNPCICDELEMIKYLA